jgi:hypothetical protein
MLAAVLLVLLILALAGGFAVNHLLWILVLVFLVALVFDHRGRVP